MRKKLLSLALVLAMALSLAPAALAADSEYTGVYQGDGYYITAKPYGNQDFLSSVWYGAYFSDGLIQTRSSGTSEFLDKDGNVVISKETLEAAGIRTSYDGCFSEGLCAVCNSQSDYGYMDKTGKVVIPLNYSYGSAPFHDGLARVHVSLTDINDHFIDRNGNAVFEADPNWNFSNFDGGFAVHVQSAPGFIDGKVYHTFQIINRNGQVQATYSPSSSSGSPAFLDSFFFSEGYGVAYNAGELHVFDTSGNPVWRLEEPLSIGNSYCAESSNEDLSGVHGGILVYSTGRADGFDCTAVEIPSGRPIFPDGKTYTHIYDNFSDGLVTFGIGDTTYGVVDSRGYEVIPPEEFDTITAFNEGMAIARRSKPKEVYLLEKHEGTWNGSLPQGSTQTEAPTQPTQPQTPAAGGFTDVAATSPFKDAIDWAVGKNITNGTTPTTFSPGATCTTRQILTFLWRSAGKPGGAADGQSDLDAAVAWAAAQSILPTGADASAPCTRASAVTYMWKAAGSPAPAQTASFTDVAADADYASAVSWAVEKGVTKGVTDTEFSPGSTCTRGQIVTFLYRGQAS